MDCKVYGMLAAQAVNFPDEIELRVYPRDKQTGAPLPGCYPYLEHKSWSWMRRSMPLQPHGWPEIEQTLKDGGCAALALGEYPVSLPDGTDAPGIVQ
jgi:hypothetical protein